MALAHRLGYLNDQAFKKSNEQVQELKRMLNGYISFLKVSKRGAAEPGATHFTREEPAPYLADPWPDVPDCLLPITYVPTI